ncbi:D-TA family PLP-dependent enzyme [Leifsonia kafniensis]|uniref:D-TA family PLP-dependent enzyme n=1 Tax=Leifsonia kafniensis TaxID=475957 RepID=A0ABP7L1G8_9MICO
MSGLVANAPDTPFLAVDLEVMNRNLERTATSAIERGLALRPHAKTHKVLEIGRRQLELGAVGLTVATVAEAEVFAAAGFDNLFIAYPVWATPSRAARLRAVAERATVTLGVDSVEGIAECAAGLAGSGVRVMIEVDSGHHRSGAQPTEAGALAAAAVRSGLQVAGVFTFPGHGYALGGRAQVAGEEADAITRATASIEHLGIDVAVRSGGSTPTMADADSSVLTELRPGVYVFNDAQQVELGSCTWADVALSARATVVSRSGQNAIVDAGSKVLGADQPRWVTGGGRLPDYPDARIVAMSEHHATVRFLDNTPPPPRGTVVRVVPNHVCSAVNLADELFVVRNETVIDSWVVAARGANN